MQKISIIVPVYNVEKYLHQCVDSIISQTYTNTEIILVDDGSPDNCGKICDEYAQKDNRIKVIHKPNGGLSEARNFGIEVATGDWLMFIDSDDYIENNMIEKLYNIAVQEDAQIALCGVVSFDETHEWVSDFLRVEPGIFRGIDILKQDCISTPFIIPCNKIFKKTIFDDIRFYVGRIHEDEMIAPYFLDKCKKLVAIKDLMYHYRQLPSSISHTIDAKRLDWIFSLYNRFFYYKNHIELKDYSSKVLKDYFWYLDKYYFIAQPQKNSAWRFKECRKNTVNLLPYYLSLKDISIKEKIMRIFFCISPSLYKYITKK